MLENEEPDKFSIVTYVSQFYHIFKDADGSCGNTNSSSSSPAVATKTSTTPASCRSSESENDSLISQSSAETTPVGTPRPANKVYNQADLIAKYGEEIFSCSSPKVDKKEDEVVIKRPAAGPGKRPVGGGPAGSRVSSLCSDLQAKVSLFEKRSS